MRTRLIEAGKTLLMFVLVATMLGLCYQLWFFDVSGAGQRGDVAREPTAERHTAAFPSGIIIGNGDAKTGVPAYRGAVYHQKYARLAPLLGEALSAAAEPVEINGDELRFVLDAPFALFEYLDPIPLHSLAAWLSVTPPVSLRDALAVRILLSWGTDGRRCFMYQTPDGAWIRCETTMRTFAETPEGEPCRFAFEPGVAAVHADPYAVLYGGIRDHPVWTWSVPDGAAFRESCLRVFSFPNTHANSYLEPDGTVVYVDDQRALRFRPDGRLIYRNASGQGAVEDDPIEAARKLAGSVLPGMDAAVSFVSLRYGEDEHAEVTMRLVLGGLPLVQAAVRVTFTGGVITEAELPIRRYEPSGLHTPLPDVQAAAALTRYGRPVLALTETDGLLKPGWVVWQP